MLPPRKCAWRTCDKMFQPQRQSDKYCPPPRKCRLLAIKQTKRKWWTKNRGTVGIVKVECKKCGDPFRVVRPRQVCCERCGG
jgi:hypothetical protein